MRYIIMCGTNGVGWSIPRQMCEINGEPIVERTIRLLQENGIEEIFISSNDPAFNTIGVPVLHHENNGSIHTKAYYPTTEPTCYLFGDVVFSNNAIKTIIATETDDIEFFASAPPFSPDYFKRWAEPFAFKVVNTEHFFEAIAMTQQYHHECRFRRSPIAWELWQVIKGTPLNHIIYDNYTTINDFTCDIDTPEDAKMLNTLIEQYGLQV